MSQQLCAPDKLYENSCFSLSSLKKIAEKLNKDSRYSSSPKLNINNYNRGSKSLLMNDIQNKLNCNKHVDFCILNKKNDFYKEIKEYMKPENPGKGKWLSTIDIKDVMTQYMGKYPEFIFYGPVPLDFKLFNKELSNINIEKMYKNGKKKIGIIFNLDYSYQSGSHWVSLFIDLTDKTICFFDSVGDNPPKEITDLITTIENGWDINKEKENKKNRFNIKINKKKHQRLDTECGVYSIYFLINRLQGKSCISIFDNLIDDKKMEKYRQVFFRNKEELNK